MLLLDKPPGFSSTQALGRAKRFLGIRKAGHTGTLDPFATGLLPLAFGEATKFSRFLIDADKTYLATLCLGRESSTGDTEGELTSPTPVTLGEAQVDEALAAFIGPGTQIPPMHSAVRIGGKRLYEFAREGVVIERAARPVEIRTLKRERLHGDELVLSVTCTKGTYIRTLAMDIGLALGCGAYLTALRRIASGGFVLQDAVGLEELQAEGEAKARARLLPVDCLVAGLPRLNPAAADALRFTQGQVLDIDAPQNASEWAVYGPGGGFLGVGQGDGRGGLLPLRLMATGSDGAAALGSSEDPDFP